MPPLLIKILIAHFIGDFVLQPNKWVKDKEKKKHKSKFLYIHLAIHYVLILIFTLGDAWLVGLIIVTSHGLIDVLKLYLQCDKYKTWYFFGDQVLHIITILSTLALWTRTFEGYLIQPNNINYKLLLYLIMVSFVTGVVLKNILSKWQIEIREEEKSLLEAGKWIGILERVLVFTFVCLDVWSAVGFLITAKSVLRFGDLNKGDNRKLTEYILIGTLVSFGIAIFGALAYLRL